jgi:hypothetical protein
MSGTKEGSFIGRLVEGIVLLALLVVAAVVAYNIRLYAISTYGRVIHEFGMYCCFNMYSYLCFSPSQTGN